MEKQPLISIITVTYNAENEIEKTLQSLKEQSCDDFEHIVVDGASKDKTLQRVKDFSLPVSTVISEPDKGLYDAMNKGLCLAKGKYVLFLNAGDSFFDSETLGIYAEVARKDFDIIYGDTCIVDPTGKIVGDRHLHVPSILDFRSFSKGMLICHQAFMVKKDIAGDYDLNYRFSADFDWCIRCIKETTPDRCLNLKTVSIRFLEAGITDKNKLKSLKERFRIMTKHYGLVPTIFNHFQFLFRALKRRACKRPV